MEMFFLVVMASGIVVMPAQYTKDECESARPRFADSHVGSICIPAPRQIATPVIMAPERYR